MFGKLSITAYTGSAIGSGPIFFSILPYVVANMRPTDATRSQFVVELNPVLLAAIIGKCTPEEIEQVIEVMCSPDPRSRSVEEEGRRLVRLGQFDFRVVNGPKYDKMRSRDDRAEQNRINQAAWRERQAEKARKAAERKARALAKDAVKDGMIGDRALEIAEQNRRNGASK